MQKAEVEREWSVWEIARTLWLLWGWGRKDESKQGPGVLHHARELDFEFRGQWEGSEGILSNDDDVDNDNHAAANN